MQCSQIDFINNSLIIPTFFLLPFVFLDNDSQKRNCLNKYKPNENKVSMMYKKKKIEGRVEKTLLNITEINLKKLGFILMK